MLVTGGSAPRGFQASPGVRGDGQATARTTRRAAARARRATWTVRWRAGVARARRCEYAYPRSRQTWKKSMHVVHTAAAPPNQGRMCLARTNCTSKRSTAERNTEDA
jgi:hypothetical protein